MRLRWFFSPIHSALGYTLVVACHFKRELLNRSSCQTSVSFCLLASKSIYLQQCITKRPVRVTTVHVKGQICLDVKLQGTRSTNCLPGDARLYQASYCLVDINNYFTGIKYTRSTSNTLLYVNVLLIVVSILLFRNVNILCQILQFVKHIKCNTLLLLTHCHLEST